MITGDESLDGNREMLDRWAVWLSDRRTILHFLEWCAESDIALVDANDSAPNAERLLDEFHDIDRAQLERERRALLEHEARKQEEA